MASFEPSTSTQFRSWAEDYGLLVVALSFVVLALAGLALFLVGDEQFARELIDRYGLAALLAIFVLEGAMLLYFAPSEILVPAAITILAKQEAGYDWGVIAAIFAVAVVGATAGQVTLFMLARRGGREWLLDKPWFRVSERRLQRFDGWFTRWGKIAIPVSNALLFTRGMLTVPAGVADMDVRTFAVLSATGTFVFQGWLAVTTHYVLELGLMQLLV